MSEPDSSANNGLCQVVPLPITHGDTRGQEGAGTMPPIDRDQYAAHLAMQGLADATIRVYVPMMVRWADWSIGNGHDPWRPDPLAVRAWSSTIVGTRSSLAHARAAIHHLCDVLQVDDVSPVIHLPREPRRQQPLLDHEQAVRLATAAETSGIGGTAVLVMMYTAARVSEAASLAWRRVDFAVARVTLQRPKTRDLHTVPLHPQLREHLEPRRVPGETWVFSGRFGGHISPARMREWVADVASNAGVGHVTPHMLRRTALTEAYDATGDLRAVQDVAGHTDPSVTATYTRTSSKRLAAAVEAIDYRKSA
jgi:integrase/recombinase XerC